MSKGKVRFGLWYDFRNPAQWRQPYDRLYGEILDQVAWGENNGFDDVWLSEHHFIDDGYLPSMLPAAAAIAARTKRIRIPLGVLLMPFHQPRTPCRRYRGSRRDFGRALRTWRRRRLQGRGIRRLQRSIQRTRRRTNESLQIIRRLLDGETLTFKGKFFEVNKVKLTPEPIQKHLPIWIGGFTPPALRRAARYGDGFTAPDASRRVYDAYVAELSKQGKPPRT